MVKYSKIGDKILFYITLSLIVFGLLMVFSTSGIAAKKHFNDSLFYFKKQLISFIIGALIVALLLNININFLKKLSPLLFFITLALLMLPFLPFIGVSAGGAKRWIDIGVRFQPGELAKLTYLIYLSGYITRHHKNIDTAWSGVIKPLLICSIVCLLFLMQPDFGSASVLSIISLTVLFLAGAKLWHCLIGFIIGGIAALSLILSSPYRLRRLIAFLDPLSDPLDKGYQLSQSLIAVGTGGQYGVGLGHGSQKLFFLPAAHTDFIFSVIAEELGFIGAVAIIAMFLIFTIRGLQLVKTKEKDIFFYSLGIGIVFLIALEAFFNMGVCLGLLPTKGMALPFISYGGSSLIVNMAMVGILLSSLQVKLYKDKKISFH